MGINLRDDEILQELNNLKEFLSGWQNKEIVLFCVGNYKIWYDSFGSSLAELLRKEKTACFVYGGKDFSILPDNLLDTMSFVENKHPNAIIIVFDNCKTISNDTCSLKVCKKQTIIAGLVNQRPFGSISVLLSVSTSEDSDNYLLNQNKIVTQIVKVLTNNAKMQKHLKINRNFAK